MKVMPAIFRGLVVIVLLVLVAWQLGEVVDRQLMDAYVREQGLAGMLLFVCMATLLVSIGLSRQLVAFLAGYGFGFPDGLFISLLSVIAGCVTTFYVARLLLRGFIERHRSARLQRIDSFIHDNTFAAALMFRLLPAGSNWLVNLAAGASSVRSLPFFLGSALGYIPQMLIFSLAGAGSQLQQFWQVAIAMAMLVAATALGGWLFARYRRHAAERATQDPGRDPAAAA